MIIFIFIILFLLIRLFTLKKEVKKINQQLQSYNDRETNKKINIALLDKDLENLATEMNKLIDLHGIEHRKRVRFEYEQKQAIANMSHDLRTPLTSIIGYIQMAEQNDVTTEERKQLLSVAKKRAKRLEALLNDFFELSIIESADHQLKAETINLKNVIIDHLMTFYDRFQERNLTPTIQMPDADVFVIGDQSALNRVVENLLTNAMSHSDGNIVIKLEEREAAVQFVVENDAYSLTKQDADNMFDRFYMADQSRSGKSTGLGLSIVKSLMEKMNGSITGKLIDGKLIIICEWKKAGQAAV